MNYKEAVDWLYSFEKFGIKLGLERITYICEKLGNPQNSYKIIHIGGTNGKGSVCKYLESVLFESGYSVGVYTSPHIQRFSERFVVNKKEISESDVVLLVEKIKPIIDDMIKNKNNPTFFEIATAMAFEYFKQKKVDFAIVEVGLGGRFDATNIVDPLVSIITNVSLEHQDRLGKTIEEISFEKAGIIKKNIPVFTAAKDDALDVIKKVAKEKNASITIVGNNYKKIKGGIDWQEFQIVGSLKTYNVKTSIGGSFQGENIALSIATVEQLQMNGVYVTDKAIIEGIGKTVNPGRMELFSFEPLILLDGAHNIAGITALKKTLKEDFVYDKLILVIGILSDKNIKEMLEIITPIAEVVIVTKSQNSRAEDPKKLKEIINGKEVFVKDRISDAIDYAKEIASKKDIICITGSLFTVGEARDYLQKC